MQNVITNGIFLLLGSNLGNRQENLERARILLTKNVGEIVTESSVYLTKAWGKTDQPDFLNQVVRIKTLLPAEALLQSILRIESDLGRVRLEKWGSRIIDIDILFYNDVVIASAELVIPHPALHQRRFTLAPMAEISPEFVHPVLKKSIHELLESCEDQQHVEKFIA